MALAISNQQINIPRGRGQRTIPGRVTFDARVVTASVVLNGFRMDFAASDHHINVLQIDTDMTGISGRTVNFRVQCQYADKNFDDPYSGYITVTIIAETV